MQLDHIATHEPDALLTEIELAQRLKASRRTVINWRMQGRIPHVLCGRLIRYVWGDVVNHLRRTSPKGAGVR